MCLAIPRKIISLDRDEPLLRMDRVNFGEYIEKVSLADVANAAIDDCIIVRAGFVLSAIERVEAQQTLDLVKQLTICGAYCFGD